ncbi:unnamed protein product [Macrosiphum euphorbiae]|uniref:Uncharacterized protein n=1 Tax=Macrosiphum euphorbiae TaxID=13131 RepID=A0AAV0VVI4_9HEMI|nr:unnamed protein product [Macrosiphum euphorbiae]
MEDKSSTTVEVQYVEIHYADSVVMLYITVATLLVGTGHVDTSCHVTNYNNGGGAGQTRMESEPSTGRRRPVIERAY